VAGPDCGKGGRIVEEPPGTLIGPPLSDPDPDGSANERGGGRTVVAEWALWGKAPQDPEYSVLRCSKGAFGRGDFHGIITRYASGAKGELPQYTVCWIPEGNGRERYLAVAIHELADPDPRLSGGRVRASRGREIEYIRLFCVRYDEMAKHRASYADLVESVMEYQLPVGLTDPMTVDLLESESPSFSGEIRALAGNVATLLLTTRPVCILGADRVAPQDRLHFIDAVMSLLPYGLHATLSASTWASATAQDLKLRMFFTNAERGEGTEPATWGRPVRFDLSEPDRMTMRHYANWLEHGGSDAAEELADQTDPIRFDPDEIRHLVAELPKSRPTKDVLEELADAARHGRLPVVQSSVKRLRRRRVSPPSPEAREEYRQAIRRLDLFKEHPKLHHATRASVYRVLLDLAFAPQITYRDYCVIEDCAGGRPSEALARTMLNSGLTFTPLPWVLTGRSVGQLTDLQLMTHLQEQGNRAAEPITVLSRSLDTVRPPHRPALYDFSVKYLRAYDAEPKAELTRRGYFADMLATIFLHDQQAQRIRLEDSLRFVYGRLLSDEEIAELRAQSNVRRTAAFDAAVARLTASPKAGGPGGIPEIWKRIREGKVVFSAVALVLGLGALVFVVIFILVALLLHRMQV
jgi:hypothetical protein